MKPKPTAFGIVSMLFLAVAFCAMNFSGCATGADGRKHFSRAQFEKDWSAPATQAVVRGVESAALNVGLSALTQFATGEPMDLKADAISGGILALRSTIGTATPLGALNRTVAAGISDPVLSQPLADAVTLAVQEALAKNLPPDVAKEAVAQGLDLTVAAAPAVVDASQP